MVLDYRTLSSSDYLHKTYTRANQLQSPTKSWELLLGVWAAEGERGSVMVAHFIGDLLQFLQ